MTRIISDGDTAWGSDVRAVIASVDAMPETIRDTIGTALVAGSNMTITVNDAGDTITLAAATTGSSGIPASTVDVKGDLIAATANDTVARLAAGADGLVLTADSTKTTGLTWASPGGTVIPKNTQVGSSYTLALTDAGKVVESTSATGFSLTVPANASVAFPVDTAIEVCQLGAGQVTITPDSGGGTTFSEPFTTTLALTWATMFGGAISVSGGTQGTLSGFETRVRAQHDVGGSDMFTQVTWVTGGADTGRALAATTRCSSSADTCYIFEVDDFMNRWVFYKKVAGVSAAGSGFVSQAITPPVTIRLESQGSSHRCYIDGTLVGTFTDAEITTGQRGGISGYNASGILFDNFSTGSLSAVTLRTPATLALRAQYSTVSLRKRGTDEWVIAGDLN